MHRLCSAWILNTYMYMVTRINFKAYQYFIFFISLCDKIFFQFLPTGSSFLHNMIDIILIFFLKIELRFMPLNYFSFEFHSDAADENEYNIFV